MIPTRRRAEIRLPRRERIVLKRVLSELALTMSVPLRIAIDVPKHNTWHPIFTSAALSSIEKTPCFDEFKDLMNSLTSTDVPAKLTKYNNLMQCLWAHGLPQASKEE